MDSTLKYYQAEAQSIAAQYQQTDFSSVRKRVANYFPTTGALLDLGAGSGRDAAYFLAQGYDVIAMDGSPAMLEQACRYHPELRNHSVIHRLPAALPLKASSIDVVYCMSVLMHLEKSAISAVVTDIYNILRPGGIFGFCTTIARAELDEHGMDDYARRYSVYSLQQWTDICAHTGFALRDAWESADIMGRAGTRWGTIVAQKCSRRYSRR